MPRCAVTLGGRFQSAMVVAQRVNQTWLHCVNKMRMIQSKPLVEQHANCVVLVNWPLMLCNLLCLGVPNGLSVWVSQAKAMHNSFPYACYIPHISHCLCDSSNNIL
jgi:hypothetical protein